MATEKILIFDEAGNAKRMKVRIARFLDNEPVTAADKTNIRTTLDVDDSLSGTFTTPLSVTSASDSSFIGGGKVGIGTASPDQLIHASSSTGASLRLERDSDTITSGQSYGAVEWEGQDASGGGAASGVRAKIETEATGSSGDVALKFYTAAANDVATERVRIDSSGRVGVNQTSPGSYSSAADDLVVGNSSTATASGATIATVGGGVGSLYFADSTSGDDRYRGYVQYNHGSNSLLLGTNANTRWTINSTGNLVAGANLGIDFGSTTTGTGTVTANGGLLDDYEEGIYTPTIHPATSGSFTWLGGYDKLAYTKVGRNVTVAGRLRINTLSSPVGSNFAISLPFTPANLDSLAGAGGGVLRYYNNSSFTSSPLMFGWDEGVAKVYIFIDASTLNSADQFFITFNYFSA